MCPMILSNAFNDIIKHNRWYYRICSVIMAFKLHTPIEINYFRNSVRKNWERLYNVETSLGHHSNERLGYLYKISGDVMKCT